MKAEDIAVLDVTPFCTFTDVILLCTGSSRNHLRAIAEAVQERMKERDVRPLAVEGLQTTGWNVIDYGDVVVHVFLHEARLYYSLERLWGDGRPVEWRRKARTARKRT